MQWHALNQQIQPSLFLTRLFGIFSLPAVVAFPYNNSPVPAARDLGVFWASAHPTRRRPSVVFKPGRSLWDHFLCDLLDKHCIQCGALLWLNTICLSVHWRNQPELVMRQCFLLHRKHLATVVWLSRQKCGQNDHATECCSSYVECWFFFQLFLSEF